MIPMTPEHAKDAMNSAILAMDAGPDAYCYLVGMIHAYQDLLSRCDIEESLGDPLTYEDLKAMLRAGVELADDAAADRIKLALRETGERVQ